MSNGNWAQKLESRRKNSRTRPRIPGLTFVNPEFLALRKGIRIPNSVPINTFCVYLRSKHSAIFLLLLFLLLYLTFPHQQKQRGIC